MNRVVVIATVLLLTLGGLVGYTYYQYDQSLKPIIELVGEEEITLNVGEEYVESGATATYIYDDVTDKIVIKNNLDTTKVGTYEIKYSVKYKKRYGESIRKINVVDTVSPIIKLNGNETITIYVNDTYEEPGATAEDNYDGDITSNVVVTGEVDVATEGTYEITYQVKDSSENQAEVKRTVIVKKKIIPNVTTTPYVNTGKKGLPVLMYHFFYDDTEGQTGNDANWMAKTAFESQMKYLSDNNFYFPSWQEVEDYIDGKIDLPEKSVVVTVDDGDITFLNIAVPIIEKYNVKATSFAVGVWNGDGIYNTYTSSHLNVQSHSYDAHKAGRNGKGLLVNMNLDEVKNDLSRSSAMMGNATIFCYPFGHYNDTVIQGLKETGYHLAFTTNGGRVYPGQDKYKLPRVRMSRGVSLASFAQSVG